MDWFYVKDGQRTGPVSEAALKQLVLNGQLSAEALVWRDGAERWLSFQTFFPPQNRTAENNSSYARCAVCDSLFPPADVLRYENCYVCAACKPAFFQKLREGVVPKPIEAWRSGKFLVTRVESRLPDRCVKCNEPANGRTLVRKLYWHPWWAWFPAIFALLLPVAGIFFLRQTTLAPWIGTVFFFGLVAGIVAAALIRRRADVYIGLCAKHWRQYRRDTVLVTLICIFGLIAFVVSVNKLSGRLNMFVVFSFLGIILSSVIYGTIRTPLVRPRRITKEFIWLRGASPKYLAELPEWNG